VPNNARSWKRRGRSGELGPSGVQVFSKELIPKGGTVVPKNSGSWEQRGKGGRGSTGRKVCPGAINEVRAVWVTDCTAGVGYGR
jgi:hypothetical protein